MREMGKLLWERGREEFTHPIELGWRPTGAVTRFCDCGGPQTVVWTDGVREVAACGKCGKAWDVKTNNEIKL
jgi:hypothetical protein